MTFGDMLCDGSSFGNLTNLMEHFPLKFMLNISVSLLQVQSNLDYPDSLGLDEIVRIIEGPDNRKYEY